jgi:serine/threonine-protein phosphatase PP1 catalytic subunit
MSPGCIVYSPKFSSLFPYFHVLQVDRGPRSLEVMSLLLAFKLRWPNHVHLLRGNHETASMSQVHGFKNECLRRCGENIWQFFVDVFNVMPLVAHIAPPTSTLLVHGGISPHCQHLDQIDQQIKKPIDWTPNGQNNILTDLLWSDPCKTIEHWAHSARGTSFHWGMAAAKNFMDRNDLKRIVRAHTAEAKGYGVMGEKHEVVTVFSAPNYQGGNGDGCIMVLDTNGDYKMLRMEKTNVNKVPAHVAAAG